jgi:hypothetical protein
MIRIRLFILVASGLMIVPAVLGSSFLRSFTFPQGDRATYTFLRQAPDGGFFVVSVLEGGPPYGLPSSRSVSAAAARPRLTPKRLDSPMDICQDLGYPRRVVILRTDSSGAARWINEYKVDGAQCTSVNDLTPAPDGGAILVGNTEPRYPGYIQGSNQGEPIAFRIDDSGSITWSEFFQTAGIRQPLGFTIKPAADGKYLIAAYSHVITLNPNGTVDSAVAIQGGNVRDLVPAADGFFACGDATLDDSFGNTILGDFVAKFAGSSMAWGKFYGISWSSLQLSPDQTLVAQAFSDTGDDVWKFDLNGQLLWAVHVYVNVPGVVDGSGRLHWGGFSLSADGLSAEESFVDFNTGGGNSAGGGIFVTADGSIADAESIAPEMFLIKRDPLNPGCLTIRSFPPPDIVPLTVGAFATPVITFAQTTLQLTALGMTRSCLASVSRTECAPGAAKRGIAAEQVGCAASPQFFFDLDPTKVTATPNPWNTPAIARVLTHKYGSDDAYPSTYQIDRHDVTLRPRFRFTGTAANGNGTALNVWFRSVDPPDTAPYVVQNNDAHDNDNKDTFSAGKGILMTPGCTDLSAQSTCAALNGNVLATATAPDGKVEVVLETTDRYAGDNYQILASFSAPGPDGKFPCEAQNPNTCDKSAPITAWKRVYMEQHSMFRRGSFFRKDALTGATEVFVTDLRMFHSGDHVVFMHSPGAGGRPVSESHVIDVVPRQGDIVAHLHLTDAPLAGSFLQSTDPKTDFIGDAVGVSNAGGSPDDLYVAYLGPIDVNGTTPVHELFGTMFIDVQFTPGDLAFVPLQDNIDGDFGSDGEHSQAFRFADHWFQNRQNAATNNRMLIGAARSDRKDAIGVTVDRSDLHTSYSFRGKIEDMVHEDGGVMQNLDPDVATFENVAHELMHQWRVNLSPPPPGGDGIGHCVENAFDNPKMFCKMHQNWDDAKHNIERGDGVIRLHYVTRNQVVDSEYVTARQAAEPMP